MSGWWDWSYVAQFFPYFLAGVPITVLLAVAALVLGSVLGLALALMEMSGRRWLQAPARIYIEAFRGTPLMVQILFIAFAIPFALGYTPNRFVHGIAALALNSAAYISQIFRAGIESVDHGQVEAARSLGMTHAMTMRAVVLPQAARVVVPPLTNELITLLKDSSLVFAIGIPELTTRGRLMASRTFRPVEAYALLGVMYLVLTIPLSYLARRLERRLSRGVRRPA
ncbi:MAG: amino acid ABC transporter permease [Thermaerobacter sp.]|nr:amino acid ABC transporter permease [Bacillota bacterium]REJ37782.1 MAG: amino acid ABC transporter permease [Bacillota bacterium]